MTTTIPATVLLALCLAPFACSAPGSTEIRECAGDACASDCCQEGLDDAMASNVHAAEVTDELVASKCCEIEGMYTYQAVFLSGQVQPSDFEKLRNGGVRTVVNLRHESELSFDEAALARDSGMRYENPAFKAVDELTDEVIDRTRTLLREAPRPLLVHCSSGNRVGAVWLAYRILDQAVDPAQALKEAKRIGLRSSAYEKRIMEYVGSRKAKV